METLTTACVGVYEMLPCVRTKLKSQLVLAFIAAEAKM